MAFVIRTHILNGKDDAKIMADGGGAKTIGSPHTADVVDWYRSQMAGKASGAVDFRRRIGARKISVQAYATDRSSANQILVSVDVEDARSSIMGANQWGAVLATATPSGSGVNPTSLEWRDISVAYRKQGPWFVSGIVAGVIVPDKVRRLKALG